MATNFHSQSVISPLSMFDGSNEVRIFPHVNDKALGNEIYRCKLYDQPGSSLNRDMMYITVDHLNEEITLGMSGYFTKDGILAILTGDTQTLNHVGIRSNDGKMQGNMDDNIIRDFRNCPVMECLIKKSGESIIQSCSNKVVVAQVTLRKRIGCDFDAVIKLLYNSKVFLNSMTKMFAILLAFKAYRAYIKPLTIINPIKCSAELDGLAKTNIYTISKDSFGKLKGRAYSYFKVTDWSERRLFSFESSANKKHGFIFKLIDTSGHVMFTAILPSPESPSRIYIDNQQEIGMIRDHYLHVGLCDDNKMHGKTDRDNKASYTHITRWSTKQRIARIEPDSIDNPKKVIIFIHPSIDTQHKAIILTYALQLTLIVYKFFFDTAVRANLSQPIPNYSPLEQPSSSNTSDNLHSANAATLSTSSHTSASQDRKELSQMSATHNIPPRSELSANAAVTPGHSSYDPQTSMQRSPASPPEPPLGATPLILVGTNEPTVSSNSPNRSSGMTDCHPQN